MGDATVLAKNKMLDHFLGTAEYTFDSTMFVGLATVTIDENDDTIAEITECAGTGYARQALTMASAASKSTTNSGNVDFAVGGADWGTITDMFICVAVSGECDVLWFDELAAPKTPSNGDTIRFADGTGITISFT